RLVCGVALYVDSALAGKYGRAPVGRLFCPGQRLVQLHLHAGRRDGFRTLARLDRTYLARQSRRDRASVCIHYALVLCGGLARLPAAIPVSHGRAVDTLRSGLRGGGVGASSLSCHVSALAALG